MRILIVSQYFWPESFIINDLARSLCDKGNHVVIATGKPNYPEGKVFPGYKEKGVQHDIYDDRIDVYRAPLRPRGGNSPGELVKNYLSFIISGLRWFPSLLSKEKFDIIFVFAPSPITSAIPAIWIKFQKKAHLVTWVQDLWPESINATGYVNNRILLWLTGLLVRLIYAGSDTLLVQSRAFIEPMSRYTRRNKIIYYPNSCLDIQKVNTETTVSSDLLEYLQNHFCLVFAGNIAAAQSIETFIKVCERLQNLPDFRLVVVGSGKLLPWLEQQKESKNLENLYLAGRFSPHEMWPIYKRASGLLVSLKKRQIFSYTIPSKVQTYLATGKPIIAALDGEGARVIEEAGAGLTSGAEDVEALVYNIERLYKMSQGEREALGKSGRRYFLDHFEMHGQTDKLVNIFHDRLNSGRKDCE